MRKLIQTFWDVVGIPFRFTVLRQEWVSRLGWTTMDEERMKTVLPYIRGYLLDIGAGNNNLVNLYGNGAGVDVFDFGLGGGAMIVKDSSNLPFRDQSFDTITIIAALNHIPYRQKVLCEARRLIAINGRLIIL